MAIALYTSPPPFFLTPLYLSFFPPVSTFETVTIAILSYAVLYLHEGTGKLWKTCADTVGDLTKSVSNLVSEKMTFHSAFRCAGHGQVDTNQSTDCVP